MPHNAVHALCVFFKNSFQCQSWCNVLTDNMILCQKNTQNVAHKLGSSKQNKYFSRIYKLVPSMFLTLLAGHQEEHMACKN